MKALETGCPPQYHTRGATLMSHSVLSLLCLALWLIPGGERKHTETKETPPSPEFTRLLGVISDGGVEKLWFRHNGVSRRSPRRTKGIADRHLEGFWHSSLRAGKRSLRWCGRE
jgi:hypothetical protein